MAGSERIRVLIADDNRAVRKALRLMLDDVPGITVAGEVTNGIDAVAAVRSEQPDVILMDIHMPGMNGLDATRELTRARGSVRTAVIVLTSFAVDDYVVEALDHGAAGYLLKSHDLGLVVPAVRAAARGGAWISPQMAAPMLREFVQRGQAPDVDGRVGRLTHAERRVVALLSKGVTSNEAVAGRLHLSVHTVRSQVQSAMKKAEVNDRTQLALWGARNGLEAEAP